MAMGFGLTPERLIRSRTAITNFLDHGLYPHMASWWKKHVAPWWRRNVETAPRLARACALFGGIAALPLALLGVFAGELGMGVGGYLGGGVGSFLGLLVGFVGFAGGSILAGAWIGLLLGKWLTAAKSQWGRQGR